MPSSARLAELGEFRPAVVDHRRVHRAQDAVRHRRRARESAGNGGRRCARSSGTSSGSLHDEFVGFGGPAAGVELECRSAVKACRHAMPNATVSQALTNAGHPVPDTGEIDAEIDVAERLLPGLERRLKAEITGRRDVRPLQPRPLCHRRLALPDHAARRGRAAHDRRRPSARSRFAREEGVQRAAARRRHLAVPGRRSTSRWSSIARSISTASSSSTSPAAAARSSPASCSTTSTASSSRTACGFRSMSRPPRAPPSAA